MQKKLGLLYLFNANCAGGGGVGWGEGAVN